MLLDNTSKVLITGGCGFIGHHVVEHLIKNTGCKVVVFDKLTYASSGFDRLRDIKVFDSSRISIFTVDFTKPISEGVISEVGDIDYILHLGAETHVDNSITDPESFVMTNVVGTFHMLEFARKIRSLRKFIYFSTDEVFGPAPDGISYKEWDRYNSGNPYSATKAGGEELCLAYGNTYKLPIVITHTMNVFGERQHPEKFIPSTISKVLAGDEVIIHADAECKIPGSRFYIHARNVADTIVYLLDKSKLQSKYNIVGIREVNNLELAQLIAGILGKKLKYKLINFHESRPGHDLRYALDGMKLWNMGYRYPVDFEISLRKTIEWYLHYRNKRWLQIDDNKNK